jgi:4-hydroxybenzoate polyprenyltransferase
MEAMESEPRRAPLAVDLDGTLIRTDIFFESILRFIFASPQKIPLLLCWLMRGRAYAKARLAESCPIDAALLPYDERVLAWLNEERANGRTLALATASDARAARAVADHVGLFDDVFASDGQTNLKSARKAERLSRAYPGGFVYAGNERADVKVWRAAQGAVVVNGGAGLSRAAARACAVEREFPRQGNWLEALFRAIRPQHWTKNALVFLPMITGQGWGNLETWTAASLAFWALSLTASAIYLFNDAADIVADRKHPRKRRRPFASGDLPLAWGLAAAVLLLLLGGSLAVRAGILELTLLYAGATLAYTLWLKRYALMDVFLLAGLYTLRIVMGGMATGYFASSWLLAFSCFFFLSLALVKRVAETRDLDARGGGSVERRGYVSGDTHILSIMGVSAGFTAALVLALYLQDEASAARYSEPFLLWGLPAACLLLVCRFWLKASRGDMHDDPIVFAARDPWSWAAALFGLLCLVGAAIAPERFIPVAG